MCAVADAHAPEAVGEGRSVEPGAERLAGLFVLALALEPVCQVAELRSHALECRVDFCKSK